MSLLEALAVVAAGLAAGTINAIVGTGSLITFPTLLAVGVPPLTANVSNTVGLAPGSVSGAIGYRRELTGQRARLIRLGVAAGAGGATGSVVLLSLPEDSFLLVVPFLVGLGVLLVIAQPWIVKRVSRRADTPDHGAPWLTVAMFGMGIYGGYFGAAIGVLLIAALGIGLDESMQRVNAAKNVIAGITNGVAALLFIAVADLDWTVVGLIAAGSIVGGQLGAVIGRRLPSIVFRSFVVVMGVVAIWQLL